jgi:hypothetical protein
MPKLLRDFDEPASTNLLLGLLSETSPLIRTQSVGGAIVDEVRAKATAAGAFPGVVRSSSITLGTLFGLIDAKKRVIVARDLGGLLGYPGTGMDARVLGINILRWLIPSMHADEWACVVNGLWTIADDAKLALDTRVAAAECMSVMPEGVGRLNRELAQRFIAKLANHDEAFASNDVIMNFLSR